MKKLLVLLLFVLFSSSLHAATSWYLPEGSTQGSFDLWILVTNPNSTTVDIKYTFYTEDGAITYTDPDGISSNSRETLSVLWLSQQDGYSGLQDQPISTKVECTNGYSIYVERAMYWDAGGIEWAGGHTARGISDVEGAVIGIGQPSSAYDDDTLIYIDQPGSYKLISNIDASSYTDYNAIQIASDNVTLDLNGFTITGPGYDQGTDGIGVILEGNIGDTIYNFKIFNGNIEKFRLYGMYLDHADSITIRDVAFYYNGKAGVYVEEGFLEGCQIGLVTNCQFHYNGHGESSGIAGGMTVGDNYIVKDNSFYYNKGYGIYLQGSDSIFTPYGADYNLIMNNTVSTTQDLGGIEAGIYVAGNKNRIVGNSFLYNNDNDIYFAAAGDYNTCINNTVDTAVTDGGGTGNDIGNADVPANDNNQV